MSRVARDGTAEPVSRDQILSSAKGDDSEIYIPSGLDRIGNHTTPGPPVGGQSAVIIIINDTLARSLEPVVTECKECTIRIQT